MQTATIFSNTDIGFGGRIQGSPDRPRQLRCQCARRLVLLLRLLLPNSAQIAPLDTAENHRAFHLGIEHRFNQYFAVFARMAQSFRVPNVDERVGTLTDFASTSFDLKTQLSHDYEAERAGACRTIPAADQHLRHVSHQRDPLSVPDELSVRQYQPAANSALRQRDHRGLAGD
jgi:hypothetical protein